MNYIDGQGDLWIEVQANSELYAIPGIRLTSMCTSRDLGSGFSAAVTHMNFTAYLKNLIIKH